MANPGTRLGHATPDRPRVRRGSRRDLETACAILAGLPATATTPAERADLRTLLAILDPR